MSRIAFNNQKSNAKKRGIVFHFTYHEWCSWWEEHLGPNWVRHRGCIRGKYVMARFNDVGPYSAHNVKCVLSEDNHAERNKRLWASRYKHKDEPKWYVRSI